MKRLAGLLLFGCLAPALFGATLAGPLSREKTPEPLRPWIDWVLYGHEEALCPFFQGTEERRQCAWPARLALDLGDRSGRFSQQWLIYRDGWVPLPGDAKLWPQEVRIDGRSAVVTLQGGHPSVRLDKGPHAVSGRFSWDALPPLLQVPNETGLLELTVRGQRVEFPGRDEQGRLWLQKRGGSEAGENRLEITVYRTVTDEIPLLLTTHIDLQVSGKGREALLGRALPAGFVPMSLDSPLPARLEPDGRLRIQVRPGSWSIDLTARHVGPLGALTLAEPGGPWDPEEVWVFDARPHLRLVTVEGAQGIDPQQTTLPDHLKRLPAYLMRPGATMTLQEKRRGDADPAPDQLALQRTLWLDFDGGGYTIHDRISGSMLRGWRLEMQAPAVLGRAAVGGTAQFITRLSADGPAGIELRQGQVRLDADSRIDGGASSLPAVGWDHDFNRVSGQLNLPPGWRLFHASGVDDVSSTWISSWTLLDLFLALIAALAVGRLWGRRWGACALITFALTWKEPGAPRYIWLFLLAGEALARALPEGRIRRVARLGQRLALVILAIIAVPFMVQQVRTAIYPVLELPFTSIPAGPGQGSGGIGGVVGGMLGGGEPKDIEVEQAQELVGMEEAAEGDLVAGKIRSLGYISGNVAAPPAARRDRAAKLSSSYASYLNAVDPKAVVQTGPGLPAWGWKSVSLRWRGPVDHGQRLRLFLVPPGINFLLAFLRVALLAILGLCTATLPSGGWPGALLRRLGLPIPPRAARAAGAALLVVALVAASAPEARAEMPPADMLETLRTRLLAPPDCHPNCAQIPRLALEITPGRMLLRIEAQAAVATAIPLPGGADQWLPDRVLLDGAAAPGLARSQDGRLWLPLSPGSHQLLMDGPLPDRDVVQIPLPLAPHQVTVRAQGWRVDGLREDGRADDNLQLTQIRTGDRTAAALERGTLPPFVRVERELSLGLKWRVTTKVVRLTPLGAAALVEVPLLKGESVTSAEVRVVGGKAQVSLAPQVSEVGWESALEQQTDLTLRAPDEVPWTEVWRLVVGPVWHLEAKGIPMVHLPDQGEVRLREWRPWPGESVSLAISRPEGLPGQTLTIDSSSLTLAPGLRATDATLELSLRSSRGGQHVVSLPEGADLQSVSINGVAQPIRQEGRAVTLPLVPGRQIIVLVWRESRGIRLLFRAPEIDLGAPSVNATCHIAMPADRWTLFARGPRLGPAVLFWSLLFVSLLASLGLGQVRLTPLRWQHWFLLSLGLTQVPLSVAILIVTWLVALGWRKERGATASEIGFDLYQALLVGLTLFALGGLFWSIQRGLLGLPEMQIAGNGSTSRSLQWYLDRAGRVLPRPWVLSVHLMLYRLAMLAWALWLAQALLRWLTWGWGCFTDGGLWRPLRRKPRPTAPPTRAPT